MSQTYQLNEQTWGCKEIAAEARTKKMWVFDPVKKDWYTPEEFLDKYARIADGFDQFFKQVQIRDPDDGIKAGFQRISDMQVKVQDFAVKVAGYYKSKK